MTYLPLLLLLALACAPAPATSSSEAPESAAAPSAETPGKLSVGDPAPKLSIDHWVKGEAVESLTPGKVWVVEFWATWCKPCITAFPHISELQEKYPDDVAVIGVSDEKLEVVQGFLEKPAMNEKMRYRVATDPDRSMYDSFMIPAGQSGIPCSFLVDRKGIVRYIGHPIGMDDALAAVVKGEKVPEPVDPTLAILEKLTAVEGEHTDAARVWIDKLSAAAGEGPVRFAFEQKLTLPGDVVQSPDGKDMVVAVRGDATFSPGQGARIETKRTLNVPGMPEPVEESETVVVLDEAILVERTSPMMPATGPMRITVADAEDLAQRAPFPALVILDPNPLLANPYDALDYLLARCALDVAETSDGTTLLRGKGAPFLGLATGPDAPPVDVEVTLDAATSLPTRVTIGDASAPGFVMTFATREPADSVDAAIFTIGEGEPGDLAAMLRSFGR